MLCIMVDLVDSVTVVNSQMMYTHARYCANEAACGIAPSLVQVLDDAEGVIALLLQYSCLHPQGGILVDHI